MHTCRVYLVAGFHMEVTKHFSRESIHDLKVVRNEACPAIKKYVTIRTEAEDIAPHVTTTMRPAERMYVGAFAIPCTVGVYYYGYAAHLTGVAIERLYGARLRRIAHAPLGTHVLSGCLLNRCRHVVSNGVARVA